MSFFYNNIGDTMTIYIDVVLILNFVIDMLLIIGVDMLLKRHTKFRKIVISSLIGSLSTLLLFVIKGSLWMFMYKLVISVFLVIIAFGYKGFDYFKENLFWLYIISIILGGSLYLLNDTITLECNGLVFSKGTFGYNIFLYLPVGLIILFKYIMYVKSYRCNNSNYLDVSIYYKDLVISETGFVDTGNNLRYFNKPVILVNGSLVKGDVLFSYMPYKVVGCSGLLKVFKPDKVVIDGKDAKVLVGISDINYKGVNIILNKEAL